VAYQKVPVRRGETYEFTAQTQRQDPFNNGNVNEVTMLGIDPVGGADAAADSVVWSSPEYASGVWRTQKVKAQAQADTITVFLRARALYAGFGMEGIFAKARLQVLPGGPSSKPGSMQP